MLVGGGGEGEREGILTTLLLIDSRPVGCVWHKYGIMSLPRKISAALDFGCRSYSIRAQVISVNYLAAAGDAMFVSFYVVFLFVLFAANLYHAEVKTHEPIRSGTLEPAVSLLKISTGKTVHLKWDESGYVS